MIQCILPDKNNIIMKFDNNIISYFKNNIEQIFENYIMHNNIIFNTYIFNHITYTNTDAELENKIIITIENNISSYLKSQLFFFRDNKKKNKFSLNCVNNFIDTFYKLVMRINILLIHIKRNHMVTDVNKKWGASYIINYAMHNLCNIILVDNIIDIAIQKSIRDNMENERNNDMYRFIKYIKILTNKEAYYKDSLYNNIILCIDNTLVSLYDMVDIECDMNILQVYQFKSYYNYSISCNNKYYYLQNIINDSDKSLPLFVKLQSNMIEMLNNIIDNNNVKFLHVFINEYKNILIKLNHTIDIISCFISKTIDTFTNKLLYYESLYNIMMGSNYINNNNDLYFKKFGFNKLKDYIEPIMINLIDRIICNTITHENIIELVDNISNNIIKTEINSFFYLVGSRMKNKDEFLKLLCIGLMYRTIYCSNTTNELLHYDIIVKYFTKKELYQYSVIINDITNSDKLINLYNVNCKNKLLDCCNNKKITIISLDCWNINHMIGCVSNININGEFTEILMCMILEYEITHLHSKTLEIYPHLGMIDCNINNCNVIMNPIHMMCLELFNKDIMSLEKYDKTRLLDEMKINLSSYHDKFLINIIESFLIGNIFTYKIENDGQYIVINNNLPSNVNLITIFNNIMDNNVIKINMVEELAHERNDILMTNINSIIKKYESKLNQNELYEKVKENIKTFEINEDMYDIALNIMHRKEYIEIDRDRNIIKLVW